MRGVRVGVLASGSGTILEAILEAGLPVAVVVVDRPCRALEVAAKAGVPAELVERASFGKDFDRVAYTDQVVDALRAHGVELVVMAGFGTVLDKPVHDAYPGQILNTHPALLPAFRGWHAVEEALAAGVKVTGLHGARGHARGRRRADPRPGGRAGAGRTTPSSRCTSGSRPSSAGSTPPPSPR